MSDHIPYAAPYTPTRKSPTLLAFANHINRTKPGSKGALTYHDPEYFVMEHLVTDEMAEVGMAVKFKKRQTIEQIAETLGQPVEQVQPLIDELCYAGGCSFETVDGVKEYWLEVWVPGHMEMFMNHPDALKYPEIAYAFDAYGKKKGLIAPGMIPMGMAPMRVIPIESAIDSNSRRASYEELSHYLDENEIFSVSNCSCRTVRESMGEGCGHLKEDMCIQMGHGAEIYIATGRGRQITREEAKAILRQAEENGLMHEIPNLDGSGKTHAICNCCGCGCLAMRNANMFQNPDFIRSNYVARIDPDKCVACGECVENCPVNALRLGQKVASKTPLPQVDPHIDRPDNASCGLERWNPDYRTNRQVIMEGGTSPCKSECPAHIGIQGYIKLASEGKYREALELIKKENPFPAVCGHICPRYCENECTRNSLDDSVAIDEIKKFIAEQDMTSEHRFVPQKRHDYSDKKIAVIGSGPAGLACAYYLAIDNYSVTVFEKESALGGMLTWGIPNFRLENDVIESEIDVLRELGVQFKTGVEVGQAITLDELRAQGYQAFYIAIGAQGGRKLGVEGEDARGVISGVDFLRRINLTEEKSLSGKTIVIGGGNVAIDVARTAIRAGAEEVTMVCLESEAQMPALPEEIAEAQHEGITIKNGWGPKRILQKDGQVTGVEFKQCLRVFDDHGRFSPEYDEAATYFLEADHVLVSIGQSIEWGNLLAGTAAEYMPGRTLKADPTTYQTAISDVFVGGDAYTGPKFAIDAIAAGKEGAISIHRFVQPGQSLLLGRLKRDYQAFDKQNVDYQGFDLKPRQQIDPLDDAARKSFRDMRRSFTPEQIVLEADRCLSCGRVYVDEYQCVGCGQCTVRCKFDAIGLEKVSDVEGVYIEDLKPIVIRNAVKTKLKRAVHSAKKTLTGK
ncbi:MAG TPA: FAD-dependent oxidoreductase [Tissierellia bacterium]|nr:FAD-dependent oxidoreductase [Tissierellia bacterium]